MARPKKSIDPTSLPGIDAPSEFRLGPFERGEKLEAITGLRSSDLRNIANNSRRPNGNPWIPKPREAHFDTLATLRGLFDLERHRAARAKDMPVYPSMEAMSQATGISVKLLREWKKAGCPAFRTRGDIVLEELLRWIEGWLVGNSEGDVSELQAEGVSNWDEYRIKYQARNEKLKNQELREQVIQKSTATETVREIIAVCDAVLQKMESEYPTLIEGRDKNQIRAIISRDCKEKRIEMRNKFEQLAASRRHAAQTPAAE